MCKTHGIVVANMKHCYVTKHCMKHLFLLSHRHWKWLKHDDKSRQYPIFQFLLLLFNKGCEITVTSKTLINPK